MGNQGRLSAGSELTDDQLVELVFQELMQEPAFRAQATAAKANDVDLLDKVRQGLLHSEDVLEDVAKQYFAKHPETKRAPYALFLVDRPDSQDHKVVVQVGNAAIVATRRTAAMQLMAGELELEVVDESN